MSGGKYLLFLVLLLGVVSARAGLFSHFENQLKKFKLPKIKLPNLADELDFFGSSVDHVTASGFEWSSCGGASDVIKINSMSVGPDPIHLPGTLQAALDFTAARNVSSPVSVDLDISLKTSIGWVKIPCLEHKGSCTYDDMCPSSAGSDCPPVFQQYGIPCSCPFKEGHYTLPSSSIEVTHISVPSFLKHGSFKVRARASMAGGVKLFCLNVNFSLN